ncbi:hypothetical protein PBI_EQUEMIOH13_67 [Mycobacterium phage Equemioh13]|uniref:hypothetical protein n=1 Tax=Mycobacterium phage Equemioh13 TaxID=1555201 RepID=UPI00051AA8FE|nr:hypothetical protein AVT12_gp39 [Mycobacterium phage Equemioh13]AIT13383.1 hypothetical protein PBI_EQUEMIOH13_67 [Mycobacterium phage Equemioh13]ATN92300.1 hypothetical protein SEA_UPDAWG_68 [Mycobacterium phage Updawg]QDM57269.1 hypothetical protein SEA_WIDEWALE_68 [Mycobacterium phage WideWale]
MKKIIATLLIAGTAAVGLTACDADVSCDAKAVNLMSAEAPLGPVIAPRPPVPVIPRPVAPAPRYSSPSYTPSTGGSSSWLPWFLIGTASGAAATC